MEPYTSRSRYRSSTNASTAPAHETSTAPLAILLHRLSRYTFSNSDNLQRIQHDLEQLTINIDNLATPNASQDQFRRSHGFQILLKLLQSAVKAEDLPDTVYHALTQLCTGILVIFLKALKDHHGNQRYLTRRPHGEGWDSLSASLQRLVYCLGSVPSGEDGAEHVLDIISRLLSLALGDPSNRRLFPLLQPNDVQPQAHLSTSNESGSTAPTTSDENQVPQVQIEGVNSPMEATDQSAAIVQRFFTGEERVRNNRAIFILANLYPILSSRNLKLETGMPIAVLIPALIKYLVNLSNQNRTAIHSAGVLSVLLPCLVRTIEGSPEMNVLRSLCGTLLGLGAYQLSEAAELFRQASDSEAARDLLLTSLRQSKQPKSIQFDLSDGGHCSVELPALPRAFPPIAGYSFAAWVRIDQFDPESHLERLMRLRRASC
jgi:hypothetical protein